MEPLSIFFILIPIGLVTGIVAALTGLGGGVLMVPILYFGVFAFSDVSAIDPDLLFTFATTISSTVIIFTALSGTIAFSIQKRIDYLVGLICVPFTIAGSYIGKHFQIESGEIYLKIFFIVLLVLTSIRMVYKVIKSKQTQKLDEKDDCPVVETMEETEPLEEPSRFRLILDKLTLKRNVQDNCDQDWKYEAKIFLAPIALIGGYVASTAGVGGGIIMVPVLTIFIGLPIHFATATSVFIMIFTKATTLITTYTTDSFIPIRGEIWWPFVPGLAIGIIGGVQIGALIAKRIKSDPLKLIFAILILAVAIWSIIQLAIPDLYG